MPRVFVRTTKGEPERREVVVSEVEGMAVEELRHTVSRLFSVPLDTLSEYVQNHCTAFECMFVCVLLHGLTVFFRFDLWWSLTESG